MNDSLFQSLNQALGYLTWPLGFCAFITFMIILERLALILHDLLKSRKSLKHLALDIAPPTEHYILQRMEALKQSQHMEAKGALLLLNYRGENQATRENILSLWLSQQLSMRKSGLKLLQLIAAIAPLMGLLGTVLGLISMFGELAQNQGPITPSQLSSGLGLAMNTTAAGLIIALPALIFAQLFHLWAEKSCDKTAYTLNQLNLWLNGVPNAMHIGALEQAVLTKTAKDTLTSTPASKTNHRQSMTI
ncbi:MotA/TolQ/ExbB proton channel family protein [uncultured Shewanella sp.]|uniref:MotA/TolQ/ExbB proton channel family protein n=1 Tax=uncultured Shewanella sp. TaxID=173975 RepID=UPI0026297698|nr:MotA/TolQ/ExbB proton channel family protein [uncultured Shewanella sp.]